jgi:hypothetical protein
MADLGNLWNDHISSESYEGAKEKYQKAILEQYKLYADLTDRLSSRAPIIDTFFLTINTAAIALIGAVWAGRGQLSTPAVDRDLQACACWWWGGRR